jgi:serine/threonine protein kinase
LKHSKGYLNDKVILQVMIELFYVFNQFWKQGFVHGDIKPHNVLVESPTNSQDVNNILKNATLVVSDLESVNLKNRHAICHTERYLDQVALKTGKVSVLSDMYSLAISYKDLMSKQRNSAIEN